MLFRSGWTATALVWVQVRDSLSLSESLILTCHVITLQIVLLTNDYRLPGQSLGDALVKSPPFWLVLVMTLSIILPWIRLRKVPVRAEILSKHAVRLYFDYGMLFLKISL